MTVILRQSPLHFKAVPLASENRDGWEVVLEYEGEAGGPRIIDLSHTPRWDVQDGDLSSIRAWGRKIPAEPGRCAYSKGLLINRMNRTQASCWQLAVAPLKRPSAGAFTEVTDGQMLAALAGREIFPLLEKAVSLDFQASRFPPPRLFQAPVFHVPAQIVYLGGDGEEDAILVACSRGYGHRMLEGLLHAGAEWGLRPAGEKSFSACLERIFPPPVKKTRSRAPGKSKSGRKAISSKKGSAVSL